MSTSSFGLAVVKEQGKTTGWGGEPITPRPAGERTSYLEVALTATQFSHLGALLESSSEFFLRDLATDCRDLQKYLESR